MPWEARRDQRAPLFHKTAWENCIWLVQQENLCGQVNKYYNYYIIVHETCCLMPQQFHPYNQCHENHYENLYPSRHRSIQLGLGLGANHYSLGSWRRPWRVEGEVEAYDSRAERDLFAEPPENRRVDQGTSTGTGGGCVRREQLHREPFDREPVG